MTPYAPCMEYITYIWLNVMLNIGKYIQYTEHAGTDMTCILQKDWRWLKC